MAQHPHRLPSVPPPCPHRSPKATSSVPFWHSLGCPGHSQAHEGGGVPRESIWIDDHRAHLVRDCYGGSIQGRGLPPLSIR
jgi:hypothetical protein